MSLTEPGGLRLPSALIFGSGKGFLYNSNIKNFKLTVILVDDKLCNFDSFLVQFCCFHVRCDIMVTNFDLK